MAALVHGEYVVAEGGEKLADVGLAAGVVGPAVGIEQYAFSFTVRGGFLVEISWIMVAFDFQSPPHKKALDGEILHRILNRPLKHLVIDQSGIIIISN